jgi:hypothetical protein
VIAELPQPIFMVAAQNHVGAQLLQEVQALLHVRLRAFGLVRSAGTTTPETRSIEEVSQVYA